MKLMQLWEKSISEYWSNQILILRVLLTGHPCMISLNNIKLKKQLHGWITPSFTPVSVISWKHGLNLYNTNWFINHEEISEATKYIPY